MNFREKYTDSIVSSDTRKVIVLKDSGESRKYVGHNVKNMRLTVYRVDGGVFTSTRGGDVKCDYAVYTDRDTLYLVELKGGDYSQAIDQLVNTLQLLEQGNVEMPVRVHTRVVLSKVKVPNFLSGKEKKLMSLLAKQYHGTHKKATRLLEEEVI